MRKLKHWIESKLVTFTKDPPIDGVDRDVVITIAWTISSKDYTSTGDANIPVNLKDRDSVINVKNQLESEYKKILANLLRIRWF